MSKRDKLVFSVKKSLVVGTATATLAASGCFGTTISNPVPPERNTADGTSDTDDNEDTGNKADTGVTESDTTTGEDSG